MFSSLELEYIYHNLHNHDSVYYKKIRQCIEYRLSKEKPLWLGTQRKGIRKCRHCKEPFRETKTHKRVCPPCRNNISPKVKKHQCAMCDDWFEGKKGYCEKCKDQYPRCL